MWPRSGPADIDRNARGDMMGWWEQSSSSWKACIVAQVGGAAILGGGVFFMQFRAPGMSVRPNFLALAVGFGGGGSIGSAVGIPYSDVVRQLMNPQFRPPVADYGWSDLNGAFACQDIQRQQFDIAQAGASAVVLGAQVAAFSITRSTLFGTGRVICETRLNIPRNIPSFTGAVIDTPQVQGGLGMGAFAFRGSLYYIGI